MDSYTILQNPLDCGVTYICRYGGYTNNVGVPKLFDQVCNTPGLRSLSSQLSHRSATTNDITLKISHHLETTFSTLAVCDHSAQRRGNADVPTGGGGRNQVAAWKYRHNDVYRKDWFIRVGVSKCDMYASCWFLQLLG